MSGSKIGGSLSSSGGGSIAGPGVKAPDVPEPTLILPDTPDVATATSRPPDDDVTQLFSLDDGGAAGSPRRAGGDSSSAGASGSTGSTGATAGSSGGAAAAPPPPSGTPSWLSARPNMQGRPVGHFVRVPSPGGIASTPTPLPPGGTHSFLGPVAPGGQPGIVVASSGGGSTSAGAGADAGASANQPASASGSWQSTKPQSRGRSNAAAGSKANLGVSTQRSSWDRARPKAFGPDPKKQLDHNKLRMATKAAKGVKPGVHRGQEYAEWRKQNNEETDWDPPFDRPDDAQDARPEDLEGFLKVSQPKPGYTTESDREYLSALRAKYPNTYAHMSDDEMLAIRRYTGNDYEKLNTALRTGQIEPKKRLTNMTEEEELAALKSYEQTLNAALSKLPRYQGPTVRGGGMPPSIDKQYVEGAIVSDPAFVSTAAGSDPPEAFGREAKFEFHIQAKNGRLVEDMGFYNPYDGNDMSKNKWDPADHKYGDLPYDRRTDGAREAEVLFKSNTRFKVVSREENVRVYNMYKRKFDVRTIIHMEEVDV